MTQVLQHVLKLLKRAQLGQVLEYALPLLTKHGCLHCQEYERTFAVHPAGRMLHRSLQNWRRLLALRVLSLHQGLQGQAMPLLAVS